LGDDITTQCVLFEGLLGKPLDVRFQEEAGSSDGGAVLLRAADERVGLTSCLAGVLQDERDVSRRRHELVDLVGQRVFGMACGYADANDAKRLSGDPIQKMLLGRDAQSGADLASQPTLSRFENSVGRKDLYRMSETLADTVIERHRARLGGRCRCVTIDMDQTDDPTHGEQQLSLFNAYYDSYCYLPLLGFVSFADEADQYLCAAILRPGNASDKHGALALLRRVYGRVRAAFPKASVRVRLDAGFACPEIFDWLDAQDRVEYVVAMGKNAVLERRVKRLLGKVRRRARRSKRSERVFGETSYGARSWKRRRRVVMKAEVTVHPGREMKDNPRFVVTNMRQSPRWVYKRIYCGRGEVENRIKELHHGLEIDRTSCSRFLANQFRVLLTAAAYVLMQEIRLCTAHTQLARAQVWTLRERLFKIGARVVVSARRILLSLPRHYPFATVWSQVAASLGAQTG